MPQNGQISIFLASPGVKQSLDTPPPRPKPRRDNVFLFHLTTRGIARVLRDNAAWFSSISVLLWHGNHEWMKGLAAALEVNTAWSSRPQPNVSSSHGFNDKLGLGWPPFRTPSVSCHSTRLNTGSTLQRSAKVTCTLHCRTALFVGISVRFIISFKWPPSYVKTSASWIVLDNFSAWSSINRITGQKYA